MLHSLDESVETERAILLFGFVGHTWNCVSGLVSERKEKPPDYSVSLVTQQPTVDPMVARGQIALT
jgi:hypothetical protein